MRYFQYTNDGYHKGNMLLKDKQIRTLLMFQNDNEEAYATVQDYNEDNEIIGCYLYFDIDNKDLTEAYTTMVELTYELETRYDCTCIVYFSGSKGFHVIAPLYINHIRCHDIAKMIAIELKFDVDLAVYRRKSWFRCNNTFNPKGQAFKIQVFKDDYLSKILVKCKEKQPISSEGFTRRELDISSYVDNLSTLSDSLESCNHDFNESMMPCMRTIWNMEDGPLGGYAHQFLHLMARHCYRSELSISEAESLFEDHPFWRLQNPRDYKKVISSVYHSASGMIGCRGGRDGDLLKDYCYHFCMFNEKFDVTDVFKKGL